MENNNKIDELFSKGIEGYSLKPSSDLKKKVFASPSAIKPIKPWYYGANGLFLVSSIITVSVILIYFGINYNDNSKNTVIYNNTISKTSKNPAINSDSKNKVSNIKELTGQPIHKDNTKLESDVVTKNINNIYKLNNSNKSESYNEPESHAELVSASPYSISSNAELVSASPNNREMAGQTQHEDNTTLEYNVVTNNTNNISELNNSNKSKNSNEPNRHTELVSVSPIGINRHAELVSASALIFMNKLFPILPSQQLAEYMNLVSEKPAHFKKGLWYVEVNSGMFVTNYKVTANNDEYKLAKNAKQEMLKPSIGCEIGINAVYQQKRVVFKAGLSYVNFGEKLFGKMFLNNPYNTTLINYNGGYYETIINGNYYDIDSTSYYHYTYTQTDHIYVNDSVLAWNTQNRPVDVLDTTNITQYDTIPKTVLYNNISYLQIPLSVGYSFPFGRFGCTILATVNPGYFVKVNGSQMSVAGYPAIEPYSRNTIKKFALSAGIGLEFNYHLNETLTIGIEPFYRKSLLGMYNKEYKLNQNANNYGFRLSIKKLL